MPERRLTHPSSTTASPTPAAMLLAHAEALAELATMLQDADRKKLDELVHGLAVLAHQLTENAARRAPTQK